MLTTPIIFIVSSYTNVVFHTSIFITLILGLCVMLTSHFLEKKMTLIQKVFIFNFLVVSVFIISSFIIDMVYYINGFQRPIPYQLLWVMDYFWFFLYFIGNFLMPEIPKMINYTQIKVQPEKN